MLTILVPTRSRPHHVRPILNAWYSTGAFEDAELVFVIDRDDPTVWNYRDEIERDARYGGGVYHLLEEAWRPLVPKLNRAALAHANLGSTALGFMGDDHIPQTDGWAARVVKELEDGPAVVSGPDGFRTDRLPTWWAMTTDIVVELGMMVPAAVDHQYCDNAVRDLAQCAGIYRWLPDLLIEHRHPFAGKADLDPGYVKVNSTEQYTADRSIYAAWAYGAARRQAEKIKALKGAHRDG